MEDTTDNQPELFVSYALSNLFVFWKQATPSASEVAALQRIDPHLRGKSLSEVATLLRDQDGWRLGPFATEQEASVFEEQLRAAGFTVQKGWL
jgi:hypothetical protein